MDRLRIALIASFVFVSFMLFVEFTQFRDAKNKERLLAQQSTLIESNSITSSNVENNPQSENVSTTINDEIPQLIVEPDVVDEVTPKFAGTKDYINVSTDTFNVMIDPHGGDIIHLALAQHLARIDTPNIPFTLLENSPNRKYISQSGLIGRDGTDTQTGRPIYYSEHKSYQLSDDQNTLTVELKTSKNNAVITKIFTFHRESYSIGVDYIIDNKGKTEWQGAYYAQILRDKTIDPSTENSSMMGMAPYLGFATKTHDERFKKIDFEDVQEEKFSSKLKGSWIAMIQHYYVSAWIPDPNIEYSYTTKRTNKGNFLAGIQSPLFKVEPNSTIEINSTFYAGPKDQYSLEKISEGLDLSVDYGFLWMIAQPLYALLYFFNEGELHVSLFGYNNTFDIFGGVANWGFSIILLTIFVKLIFFGLNKKAYTSMAKMRTIQPKMLELRDRYADDRQKQSQEMMKLYSSEGVNPLGGCLPMLVQMPVFIALYWVLLESVELRHAPFIGYINDLSAMDPYFIMPLVMGASMWFQQKLNPPPPDPMQAKVMQMLPIIFTFFFLFFPSGLVLYWIVNNILSIAQQWIITRGIEKAAAESK